MLIVMTARSDSAYRRVSRALQHAGITADEYMTMHRSHSSQHPSESSKKRKSIALHEPRSVSASAFAPTEPLSHRDITLVTADMNWKQAVSAPAAIALTRNATQRSNPPPNYVPRTPTWHSDGASHFRGTSNTLGTSRHIDATWQDPEDFLAAVNVTDTTDQNQPNYTLRLPEQCTFESDLLSPSSPQFDWSPLPSSVELSEPSSSSSAKMSREQTKSSFSSVFSDMPLTDDLAILCVKSESSYTSQACPSAPVNAAAACYPYPLHHFLQARDNSCSASHLNNYHLSHVSQAEGFEFVSDPEAQRVVYSHVASPMHRESSSSSSSSHASSFSRSHKRHRETLQHSQRSIAPALNQHSSSSINETEGNLPRLGSEQMIRVTSENGEEKVLIPKNIERQKRHSTPKLLCPSCNDHPEGFRGEHELQRHVSRAHSKIRKVWVCIDSSPDGKFLANCKACRTKKRYGAYYNAAAHLRRTHFNPRQKGRKTRCEQHEKRGGKGGGNWPPMSDLKENWLREIEEMVSDDAPSPWDEADHDVGNDLDIDRSNDSDEHKHPNLSTIGLNQPDITGAGFLTSPMAAAYSPTFSADFNIKMPNMGFAGLATHCEGDLLPQSASMFVSSNMLYDDTQCFLPSEAMPYAQM